MQLSLYNKKIVEKVLWDKEGRLVHARFAVYENNGRIRARLIDFVYLKDSLNNKNVVLLSGKIEDNKYWTAVFEKEYVSPFINLNTLYSSGSKPRAPTFA